MAEILPPATAEDMSALVKLFRSTKRNKNAVSNLKRRFEESKAKLRKAKRMVIQGLAEEREKRIALQKFLDTGRKLQNAKGRIKQKRRLLFRMARRLSGKTVTTERPIQSEAIMNLRNDFGWSGIIIQQ